MMTLFILTALITGVTVLGFAIRDYQMHARRMAVARAILMADHVHSARAYAEARQATVHARSTFIDVPCKQDHVVALPLPLDLYTPGQKKVAPVISMRHERSAS